MRAPVLGVYFVDNDELRNQFVAVCTRITHTDPKALEGSLAIALAAAMAAGNMEIVPQIFLERIREQATGWDVAEATTGEFLALIERVVASVEHGQSTPEFAAYLGLERGVSGYVFHTVPVVLHAWLTFPTDYERALESVIRCGGDTDSTGAIVGALVGSHVGIEGIPSELIDGLIDWPRTRNWIRNLAHAVTQNSTLAPALPLPFTLIRNLAFLPVVLAHGFRRLLPPY